MRHHLTPDIRTLHGAFSRDIPPALTIDPGDSVLIHTLDAAWNLTPRRSTVYEENPRSSTRARPGRKPGTRCVDPSLCAARNLA